MTRNRVAAALALGVAALLVAGCSGAGGDQASSSAGAGEAARTSGPAAAAPSSDGTPAKVSSEAIQLVDLGNRIVRKATLSLA
jgi:hypothetical protein